MGEFADMMLEGDLCECCGETLLNDETLGYPMYCSVECATERGIPKKDWRAVVVGYEP